MDHKMVMANQRRANYKQHQNNKTKKKGPLKVVYITNPIKFEASASEFRALVQELTGQDSILPKSSGFVADDGREGHGGVEEVDKIEPVEDIHNTVRREVEEGRKIGHAIARESGVQNESGRLRFRPYYYNDNDDDDDDDDGFCAPRMLDSFQGLMTSSYGEHGDYHDLDDEFKC